MSILGEKKICLIMSISVFIVVALICVSFLCLKKESPHQSPCKSKDGEFSEKSFRCCSSVSNVTGIIDFKIKEVSSCGEWCSPLAGNVTNITAEIIRGSRNIIRSATCDVPKNISCEMDTKKGAYHCIMGDCASLHGIFECTKGVTTETGEMSGSSCRNVTSELSYSLNRTDAPILCNSKKACLNLDGFYECTYGSCARIRSPFTFEKRCTDTSSGRKDTWHGDIFLTTKCVEAPDESNCN